MRHFIYIFVCLTLNLGLTSAYAADSVEIQLEPYNKVSIRKGSLDFYRTYQYSFKSSGNLSSLNVDVGEHFSRGDILASVDTDELNSELNSLLAEKAYVNEEVKRLTELRKQNAVSESELEKYKSTSSQLKAAITRVKKLMAATSIIAPYDGIVISRALELGEFVAPGQMVMEIAPFKDNLVVNLDVLESELAALKYGDEVQIEGEGAYSPKFGKVKKLTSTPNATTGLYRVSLSVEPFQSMTIGSTFDVYLSAQKVFVFKVPAHLAKMDFNQTALIKIKNDNGKVGLNRFEIADFNQDFILVKPSGLSSLKIIK